MAKPTIVILGRPNVGKSTLFNRLTGRRKAIVKNVHGVTRDRNYSDVSWDGTDFVLVDTGGFFPDTEDEIFSRIKVQALYAIEEADILLHVLDGKEGLNPLDIELANIIRASGKNALWVVNKIDSPAREDRLIDFYAIGTDELMPISAEAGLGIDEMMEKVMSLIPERESISEPDYPKIAIVGRPNVGKSTIVNALLGKDRMIVAPMAGTTRDSIDTMCTYYSKKYILIDTAGIRKKAKVEESIEAIAAIKALKSIERADIAVAVLDAASRIAEQDQRIIGLVLRKQKGLLILFNKWDLVEEPEQRYKELVREIDKKLWHARFAPVLTASGLFKKRIFKIFPIVGKIMAERTKRISTAKLNKCMREIADMLPTYKGRKIKLSYVTQVGIDPPSFALFLNYPDGIKQQHVKMIERVLREKYLFEGTPINIFIRRKKG